MCHGGNSGLSTGNLKGMSWKYYHCTLTTAVYFLFALHIEVTFIQRNVLSVKVEKLKKEKASLKYST